MAGEDLSQLKIDKSEVTLRPRKKKRFLHIALMLGGLLIAGILYFLGILTPSVDVEVAGVTQIYPSQTFTLLNSSGYVVAQRKAAVASKVTGRLISISVEEGSHVKAGQIIARLESDDVLAARDQAKANLNAAAHNLDQQKADLQDATLSFNRNKELLSPGYVSRAEYDASEARYNRAKAAVAAAEAAVRASKAALQGAEVAVEYTFIRAPFDAVVLTKDADIGDIVTPIGAAAEAKAAVVTIADMDSLQVETDVSESNIHQVKIGQPCEVQLDALPDTRFRGEVHMVVPTADRTKATIMVKVKFLDEDPRVLPEMSAKVAFLSREVRSDEMKSRTAVNPAAVKDRNGKKSVFLIKDDRVVETPVTLGIQLGDMVEVTSGVKAGDRVVLKPLNKMKDGVRVKIIEK
ncbi:MAG: efflux RND transporter periplasmic adaptor subunit [Nitrospirota bacterium]